mmetsp:Transcript_21367/g.70624  ORF Transcript_21367/g.70624 Transcript_21367/m.70624 type:complete len:326 (+) Transcript_21367:359-1336(+)
MAARLARRTCGRRMALVRPCCELCTAPTGSLRPWTAPSPFWKATAAIADAASMWLRAATSDPSATAAGSQVCMSRRDSRAMPSHIGWYESTDSASMACVTASMPVHAVSVGGRESVRSGSAITWICAVQPGCATQNLTLRLVSVYIAAESISAPVPAVVGMRTSGGQLISSTGGRVHSSSSRLLPDPATIAIDLPASRPLPPPTATKPSAACSRYAAAPATMLRSVGLASTSPKRRGCRPAAASESKSPPTTGLPLKPLSATRSGRFEPRSRSLAGSSAARPAPNVTGTGKAQSAATLERPRLLFGNSARRDEIARCMKSVWWRG